MVKRSVIRVSVTANFFWLLVGRLGGDASLFIFYVLLSRQFGQVGIGQYAFAMSLTGIFAYLADFGLHRFSVRTWAEDTQSFPLKSGRVIALRLTLLPTVLILLLLVLSALSLSRQETFVIAIVGLHQLLFTLANGWLAAFVAHQQSRLASLLDAGAKATTLLVGASFMAGGADLIVVLTAMPLATICLTLVAAVTAQRRFGAPAIRAGFRCLIDTAISAFPTFLSVFGRQVAIRSDVVLLGVLMGTAAVGLYSVGQRVIWMLITIPALAAIAILPQASRLYRSDRRKLLELCTRATNVAVLLGVPAGAGIFLIAEDLIQMIFGTEFLQAVVVLQILSLFLVLSVIRNVMSVFLTACDQEVTRARIEWIGVTIGVALQIVLISSYGILGAASATVVMEGLTTALVAVLLTVKISLPHLAHRLLMAILGCLAFSLAWSFLDHYPLYLTIPIAIGIYGAVILSSPIIRRDELAGLLHHLIQRAP